MSSRARALFGTTDQSSSVPLPSELALGRALAAQIAPVFAEDGRLVASASWPAGPLSAADWLQLELYCESELTQLRHEWLVEIWRLWDCDTRTWVASDLALYRFESVDAVIRQTAQGRIVWLGALDTSARILATEDPEENQRLYWQWARVPHSGGCYGLQMPQGE